MYSTFQSHEPEFDYLKSLEIEEKINKIRWLKRKNQAHFLLSTNGMTIFCEILTSDVRSIIYSLDRINRTLCFVAKQEIFVAVMQAIHV